MRITIWLAVATAAFLGCCCEGKARGEIVELVNGSILQGDVVDGQTDDDGLALNLYDTNGVVVVKWEHIVDTRRAQLRQRAGLDLPEDEGETTPGHRVVLVDGTTITGVALNPRTTSEPLKMKTRNGVKEYPRDALMGPVTETMIDAMVVYQEEEYYQKILNDEGAPDSAARHHELAERCMRFGAFVHAKEHLLAAKADEKYMGTERGRAVDTALRVVELKIRAKGAIDLATQIKQLKSADKWNDALKVLKQLASAPEYKDDSIREAIHFNLIENGVITGREKYLKKQISFAVFKVMDALIEKKVREQKPRTVSTEPNASPGAAAQGTLAAARQWANHDLSKEMWDKVGSDLGLTGPDKPEGTAEMEGFWKERTGKITRRANYGTGSFIVVKKEVQKGKPGDAPAPERRRPPGSSSGNGNNNGKNTPTKPDKVEKPLTEEEWWERVSASDKKAWLTAYFVETSNWFDIQGTPQALCDGCGGTGNLSATDQNGNESQRFCPKCNGAGVFRSVSYR